MEELTNEEMLLIVDRLLYKANEISTLMRDGKIVVAYEKIGGVIKILTTCGATLNACLAAKQAALNADK